MLLLEEPLTIAGTAWCRCEDGTGREPCEVFATGADGLCAICRRLGCEPS